MSDLVETNHPKLSLRRQCLLFGVARSSLDYVPVVESPEDLRIKRILADWYDKHFGTSVGPANLITISHSEDRGDGVVVVWYWKESIQQTHFGIQTTEPE